MTTEQIDSTSIRKISFIPTPAQIHQLISHSNIVAQELRDGQRTSNLSKTLDNTVVCPSTLNPDDTILCKLGRGDIGPGGKIGDPSKMITINDRPMPFGSTSLGPNTVVTDCQHSWGENRVNLFYKDIASTKMLINYFMGYRENYKQDIFRLFIDKFTSHSTDFNTGMGGFLESAFHSDYLTVCQMFTILRNVPFHETGFSVMSFCQTWMKHNSTIPETQFSVMSPHFQTRFYIINEELVKSHGVTDEHLKSYTNMIEHFDNIMAPLYGMESGGLSFVNVDALHNVMRDMW